MKTAIYIDDGAFQAVLTPENDFEKGLVRSLIDKKAVAHVYNGTFYDCAGGWTRQSQWDSMGFNHAQKDNNSLILRIEAPAVSNTEGTACNTEGTAS